MPKSKFRFNHKTKKWDQLFRFEDIVVHLHGGGKYTRLNRGTGEMTHHQAPLGIVCRS